MATVTATDSTSRAHLSDPAVQAFTVLRAAFTIAPVVFGLDKFLGLLADWPAYLWPGVDAVLPGSAADVMLAVGAVEVLAGVLVALRPRIGGAVVAVWLAGIIVNLLLVGGFLDVALRDLGLLLGAVALSRLATAVSPSAPRGARHR